jgi:hypothetical protein
VDGQLRQARPWIGGLRALDDLSSTLVEPLTAREAHLVEDRLAD